jgi:hypothetical protein
MATEREKKQSFAKSKVKTNRLLEALHLAEQLNDQFTRLFAVAVHDSTNAASGKRGRFAEGMSGTVGRAANDPREFSSSRRARSGPVRSAAAAAGSGLL